MVSKPFVVGLTGGIGCGKSVAAEELARLGARVIDTDQISHELSCPPSPALKNIAHSFGPEFIAPNGCMDRDKMRALVFSQPQSRAQLEAIFHPLILKKIREMLADSTNNSPYTVLVVPLLFEVPAFLELVHHTAVIDCPSSQQLERVQQRNALEVSQIEAIMAAQMPREERLRRADCIIENNDTLQQLRERIQEFHLRCQNLAKGHR